VRAGTGGVTSTGPAAARRHAARRAGGAGGAPETGGSGGGRAGSTGGAAGSPDAGPGSHRWTDHPAASHRLRGHHQPLRQRPHRANTSETVLNTSNVKPGTFGCSSAGSTTATRTPSPLRAGADHRGAKHNVLFVATSTNNVYAFDADDPAAMMPLWQRQLAPPGQVRVAGSNPPPSPVPPGATTCSPSWASPPRRSSI
jgi:hypothetical protein